MRKEIGAHTIIACEFARARRRCPAPNAASRSTAGSPCCDASSHSVRRGRRRRPGRCGRRRAGRALAAKVGGPRWQRDEAMSNDIDVVRRGAARRVWDARFDKLNRAQQRYEHSRAQLRDERRPKARTHRGARRPTRRRLLRRGARREAAGRAIAAETMSPCRRAERERRGWRAPARRDVRGVAAERRGLRANLRRSSCSRGWSARAAASETLEQRCASSESRRCARRGGSARWPRWRDAPPRDRRARRCAAPVRRARARRPQTAARRTAG